MNDRTPATLNELGLSYMEIERRARAMQARYAREAVGRLFVRVRAALRRNGGAQTTGSASPHIG